jgi:PAS domain S-box-containing protein
MNDKEKTKEQLIEEVAALRQRLSELEKQVFQQQQAIQNSQSQSTPFQQEQPKESESQPIQVALQDNQQFLQRIVETTPDIIYVYDLVEKRNIYINHKIIEILGYTSAEIQAMRETVLPNLIHPDDWVRVKENPKRFETLKEGEVIEIEYRMRQANGEWRWLRSQETVFAKNADGLPVQILGTARDIDEPKRATAALQESEARWKLALEAARMTTWDWNILTNIVTDHNSIEQLCHLLLGSSEQSFEDFLNAVHPEDQDFVVTSIRNALENTADYDVEFRMVDNDGTLRWVGNKGQVYRDRTGNPVRMIGVAMDITERKLAEQKIREQAALLDVSTDAIVVQDLENNIIFWNKGAEKIYGWKAEEVLNKKANDLWYQGTPKQLEEALSQVYQTGEWYGQLTQTKKDGQEVIVETRWSLVRGDTGYAKSILTVNTDITEKKQFQTQFLRAQRLESLGTLASGIAHDLNNILAPILMSAQLLQIRCADARNQPLLQTLETNAQRGAALVKQVLSFARGVEGKHSYLQIGHLILEFQQFAKQTFPKSIEFSTHIAPNLWNVYGNATQLHQVLMNLVLNARDAMPQGGHLSISAENLCIDENYARMHLEATVGRYIMITVKDTGIGMSPEILDRIFEPFFTTKEIGKGTGLGLSTVLGIIKSHGGFINVSSTPGKGTQFQVFLKAVTEQPTQSVEDAELPLGNGELILVVDDEPQIRDVVKATLETYNYKVLTASNGLEALELYAQNKYTVSVIVLDMMMPDMDGLMTIRTVQKINPNVKIIASSGMPDNKSLAEALGATTFLPKPYTVKNLLEILHSVI